MKHTANYVLLILSDSFSYRKERNKSIQQAIRRTVREVVQRYEDIRQMKNYSYVARAALILKSPSQGVFPKLCSKILCS